MAKFFGPEDFFQSKALPESSGFQGVGRGSIDPAVPAPFGEGGQAFEALHEQGATPET
jgi:hypothetical protein